MTPAVIYARYSSDNQREESIAGQLRECHAYADRNGYLVVKEYTDSALSGKTDKRPGFQKMINDSASKSFQVVIVWKLDRFARNRYDAAVYRKKLRDNGVRLCSAMENISDSPEGIILEGLLESMAEYYSANLSENIKRGYYDSALERKMTCGMLGYRRGPDGKYEIDPATAPIVQRIFEEYTSGKSRSEIVDGLNADGFHTIRGKAFNRTSLYNVLKNERYIGVFRFKDIYDPEGIPPIIDKETFEKAQKLMKNKSFSKKRPDLTDSYDLSSKIFCGECGRPMTGESARSHTGTVFRYYSCIGRKGRHHECKKSRIRKEMIESKVIEIINEKILTDDMIELFVSAYEADRSKFSDENTMLTAYQAELDDVNKRIGNISKAIEAGIWTETTAKSLRDLEERRSVLQSQIAEEEHNNPPIPPQMLREYFHRLRKKSEIDLDSQRALVDIFLKRVYVFDPEKKNGPFKAVFELSINGTDGEPISYELMLSKSSSVLTKMEFTDHLSNPIVIEDSILITTYIFPQ